MNKLLEAFFKGLIKTSSIEIETANGGTFTLGDRSGSKLGLRFNDRSAVFQLMADPEFQFGQLYMDGRIEVTRGTIFDVLMLIAANLWQPGGSLWLRPLERARGALRRLALSNGLGRARRNVEHHYDFDAAFYKKFLDSGLQYSCAYFEREGQNLENAQLAKKRHIAAKLLIEPGHNVLDIGCGFGGMAIYLARFCGASVTGVTLSQTQLRVARSGAAELCLSGATDFRFRDYRELDGRFDRIVSVGMFEHVGLAHYDLFFRKVGQLLDADGIALIHTIGRADGPCPTNPWVKKYIFPGGYMPALSEIMPSIERSGLFVTDIEILRLHYAETLKVWHERFQARRTEVAARRGEHFCRMWELYLAGCECAFRREGFVVFQIQLSKKLESVPLTRDYIGRVEAYLRERDSEAAKLRLAGE
jgi:cyclopropane-fatty-acyl-phospholipid synthase